MADSEQRFVSFPTGRGDLVVPVEPVRLLLDLEARGFRLRPDGADLIVSPFSKLTDEEARELRRWKYHVLALLDYVPPTCA